MNPVVCAPLSLPAMPADVVHSIINHLSRDKAEPLVRTVSRWSRTSHASRAQLKPWMDVHANPDQALQHRLSAAIVYGEPLLRLWQCARPFVHTMSPAGTVTRINEQLATLDLEPRCAALLVLGSDRDQLSPEQKAALSDYLIRQKVIAVSDHWPSSDEAEEACQVAGFLTMNAVDFILKGKYNAEGLAHAVMQALCELPLGARIQGLNALLSMITSVDQALYIEALQPRMADFLPPHWDCAYMQSPSGMMLLAALRMLAAKRHANPLLIAQPVLRLLGLWLDQLPLTARHVSAIERTPHHQHVLLVIQSMIWMVRRDADARGCFADEFITRGFITDTEFSVLAQYPWLTRPGEPECFDQLGRLVAASHRRAEIAERADHQQPVSCALI